MRTLKSAARLTAQVAGACRPEMSGIADPLRRAVPVKSLRTQVILTACGAVALQAGVAAILLRRFEQPLLSTSSGQSSTSIETYFVASLGTLAIVAVGAMAVFVLASRRWIRPIRN